MFQTTNQIPLSVVKSMRGSKTIMEYGILGAQCYCRRTLEVRCHDIRHR